MTENSVFSFKSISGESYWREQVELSTAIFSIFFAVSVGLILERVLRGDSSNHQLFPPALLTIGMAAGISVFNYIFVGAVYDAAKIEWAENGEIRYAKGPLTTLIVAAVSLLLLFLPFPFLYDGLYIATIFSIMLFLGWIIVVMIIVRKPLRDINHT